MARIDRADGQTSKPVRPNAGAHSPKVLSRAMEAPVPSLESPRRPAAGPVLAYLAALLGLAAFKVLLGFVSVPQTLVMPMTLAVTVLFVTVPVYALFRAAAVSWTWKLGLALVVGGLVVHVGLQLLGAFVLRGQGLSGAVTLALRDVGFFTWCTGLGAMLASMLRERNLLIPVSIFLAGFDIFLVLTPVGPVKQILESRPDIPAAMALNVPQVASQATGGAAAPFAIIGPADFVFMAMFFIALFKFEMNARSTALSLAPAILAYLCLSYFLGPIPLLVPIGLTVLFVNLKYFKMNMEEWASTALVAALAAGLIWWGATRPRPPAEPSLPGGGPGLPEAANSPSPSSPAGSP